MLQIIRVGEKDYELEYAEYESPEPRRVAIKVLHRGKPWCSLSINIDSEPCAPNQFFAKEYSENRTLVPALLLEMESMGLIKSTGVTVSSGHIDGIRQFELIPQ